MTICPECTEKIESRTVTKPMIRSSSQKSLRVIQAHDILSLTEQDLLHGGSLSCFLKTASPICRSLFWLWEVSINFHWPIAMGEFELGKETFGLKGRALALQSYLHGYRQNLKAR